MTDFAKAMQDAQDFLKNNPEPPPTYGASPGSAPTAGEIMYNKAQQDAQAALNGTLAPSAAHDNSHQIPPMMTGSQFDPSGGYGATDAMVHAMTGGLAEPASAATIAGSRYLTGQTPTYDYQGAANEQKLARDAYEAQHPYANLASSLLGGAVGPGGAAARLMQAVPSTLGRIGVSAATGAGLGAIQGGSENTGTADSTLQGAKTGAIIGGTLGTALPAIGTIAQGIAPPLSGAAQTMRGIGVQPLLGSSVGGIPAYLERIFGGFMPPIQNARADARQQFADYMVQRQEGWHRGLYDDVLSTTGMTPDTSLPIGQQSIKDLKQKISANYQNLVPQSGAVPDLSQLDAIKANLKLEAPAVSDQFNNYVDNYITNKIGVSGALSGDEFKNAESSLGKMSSRLMKNPRDSDQIALANAFNDTQSKLRDWLAQTNPAIAPQLQGNNMAWAKLQRLFDAGKMEPNEGNFTPNQLVSAATSSRNALRSQASTGSALLQPYGNTEVLARNALQAQADQAIPGTARSAGIVAHGGGIGAGILGADLMERLLSDPTHKGTYAALAAYPAIAAMYSQRGRGITNSAYNYLQGLPAAATPLSPFLTQRGVSAFNPSQVPNSAFAAPMSPADSSYLPPQNYPPF